MNCRFSFQNSKYISYILLFIISSWKAWKAWNFAFTSQICICKDKKFKFSNFLLKKFVPIFMKASFFNCCVRLKNYLCISFLTAGLSSNNFVRGFKVCASHSLSILSRDRTSLDISLWFSFFQERTFIRTTVIFLVLVVLNIWQKLVPLVPKGQLISKCPFICHRLDKNTNKFLRRAERKLAF